MDIQRFVARRKELGLSQVKLCQGICTQATLSKFESGKQIPTLEILNQLCARLGLGLDDLNQGSILAVKTLHQSLAKIEEGLMIEDFLEVRKLLKKIDPNEIWVSEDRLRYYYLEGMTNVLTNQPLSKVVKSFSYILKIGDPKHHTLYTYLAYLGEGIFYIRHDALKQAHFFFRKVEGYFRQSFKQPKPDLDYAYLTMAYFLAEYYAVLEEFSKSNEFIKLAWIKCTKLHRTYYLPRLKLLEAENYLSLQADQTQILESLEAARAFAQLNNNNTVLVQVAALLQSYRRLVLK